MPEIQTNKKFKRNEILKNIKFSPKVAVATSFVQTFKHTKKNKKPFRIRHSKSDGKTETCVFKTKYLLFEFNEKKTIKFNENLKN